MKKILFPIFIVIVVVLAGALPGNGAITDGLVSYWPLDATNSTTTPDASFANDLTAVGPVTVSAGQVSNAFTFNGTSTYLTNLHSPDNGPTGLPIFRGRRYTICMWVKGAAQTAKFIFSLGNATNTNPLLLLQTGNAAANNSKFDLIIRTDNNVALVNHIASTNVVFNNAWHHLALVDDRGNVKVYVDGALDAANYSYDPSYTDFTFNTTAIATLVRTTVSTGSIFNGQIDDLALWERALSADEVNQVRTNGISTPISPRAASLLGTPAGATKHQGDWHLLAVDATGNRPLSYQWSKNGSPITDATNRTYLVTGLQTNNSGDFYSVTVTNPYSVTPATSPNAILEVLADPAPSLTNRLVNYWPLDVITQDDTNLFSPEMHFGHKMVLRNFTDTNDFIAGQYSNALFFLASLPKWGYRTNGSPIYNRTNYTIALWVKGNGTGQSDRRIFSEGSSLENNSLISLGIDFSAAGSAYFRPFFRNSAALTTAANVRLSTRAVFDDNWHQVTWTDANGQGKLYVDGVLDETDYTYNRLVITNLNMTVIGGAARVPTPVSPFTGNLDEVATWDRVLTWTEIQQVISNGIPIPEGIVAPTIITQPPERTNRVFVGDDVSFPVVANGTLPFDYQWRKNGAILSAAVNPSAVTDTLILTNVQVADSNTTYFVVITNASGSVTSSIVRLYVTPWTPVTNGEALKVDFGLIGSPNAQPGFFEMTLGANPDSFANGVRLTLSGINTTLADRNRITGAMVPNTAYMSQAQIYNDFIFGNNSTTDGTGFRLLIERLAPNTLYGVTIWSFDPQSGTPRVSDWTETSSGTPITIQTGYTFDGTIQPTNDFEQTVGGLLTSSTNGTLQIEAVRNGGNSFGAFINAIRLVANPVPTTRITRLAFFNGNIRFNVVGEYPGQSITIQQNTNLVGGTWIPAVGGSPLITNGMVISAEFPVTEEHLFYRAVSP